MRRCDHSFVQILVCDILSAQMSSSLPDGLADLVVPTLTQCAVCGWADCPHGQADPGASDISCWRAVNYLLFELYGGTHSALQRLRWTINVIISAL
jgi:hypothetical protein